MLTSGRPLSRLRIMASVASGATAGNRSVLRVLFSKGHPERRPRKFGPIVDVTDRNSTRNPNPARPRKTTRFTLNFCVACAWICPTMSGVRISVTLEAEFWVDALTKRPTSLARLR